MKRKQGHAKNWRESFPQRGQASMIRIVVVVMMAVLSALPVAAQEDPKDRWIPLTEFTPERLAEVYSCENVQKHYTTFMRSFLQKNKTCKEEIVLKERTNSTMISCGACCEYEYGQIKPEENEWSHPCSFPKTCAEEMEREYCRLTVLRERLARQCPDKAPTENRGKLSQVYKKLNMKGKAP